jgi:rhamnosyltransferase
MRWLKMNRKINYGVQNGVCAIVVTFRPGAAIEANLAAIRPQVEGVVVVDNGSSSNAMPRLRSVCDRLSIRLIENRDNLGLPAALNIGITLALQSGYRWVALFDQDSTATEGMIEGMLEAYERHASDSNIGIVAPRYRNRLTAAIDPNSPPILNAGMLDAAWTSGSLIPAQVLKEVGGFEESLFIDLLDYDFSLRVRSAGYAILLADQATLLHEAGFPVSHRLLGLFTVRTDNHKPARRYYFARNRVWIVKKYQKLFPGLVRKNIARQMKELTWMLLCETNRWQILKSVADGIIDGMNGRMGYTREL